MKKNSPPLCKFLLLIGGALEKFRSMLVLEVTYPLSVEMAATTALIVQRINLAKKTECLGYMLLK